MPTNQEHKAFTGRTRNRAPKRSVKVIDRIAQSVITLGGLGSIAAVSMVGVFLVWVAAPLFTAPSLGDGAVLPTGQETPVHIVPNEYMTMAWSWTGDGRIRLIDLTDGSTLSVRDLPGDGTPTARASAGAEGDIVLGYDDGSIRFGSVGFVTSYVDPDELTDDLRGIDVGAAAPHAGGMIERTPEDQFRLQSLEIALDEPAQLSEAPITAIDMSMRPTGPVVAALDAEGRVSLRSATRRRNLLTGETVTRLRGGGLDLPGFAEHGAPAWLLLNGQGDNVFAAWRDGRILRLDTRTIASPVAAETFDVTADPAVELTALGFQIGKSSLVAGDSEGGVTVWYRVRPEASDTADGLAMRRAKTLAGGDTPVTVLAASLRSRTMAAGHAGGSIRLFYVTNERLLAEIPGDGAPVTALALSPRDDALVSASGSGLALQSIAMAHPEASPGALITAVWYEGYDEPAHVWQSSGGTDDFEPKYGLMPLVFGTLKATFYTMIFGLPLALLAAIYTSEFLEPSVKSRVKPAVEMMASLPSVVLGFLAALVFAPWLESRVPAVLAAMVTVPVSLLLGAHLWQLLPVDLGIRLRSWKLPAMALFLPLGFLAASVLGGPVESLFFAGDLVAWLDGQVGDGAAGWMFMLLPLSALAVGWGVDRWVNGWLRDIGADWTARRFATADLAKFAASVLGTLLLAYGFSWLLASVGLDPRGSFVGTYVQRNALVVGFVMGFAVIPIIYTIAEDALSAVPDHLRAASLGAGATPWQTAVRVVIPPAMSGLFSATMIGLGRAVGETMIVLMAAGNTPIMDGNIFNGFRTLSANIAVELPEAVQNSTHFRTLFLAALTLFVMTFLLNTVAEIVRMKFRRKAYQL